MKKMVIDGKKAYVKEDKNRIRIYASLIDYIFDEPDPNLTYKYKKENGLDTVLERILKNI